MLIGLTSGLYDRRSFGHAAGNQCVDQRHLYPQTNEVQHECRADEQTIVATMHEPSLPAVGQLLYPLWNMYMYGKGGVYLYKAAGICSQDSCSTYRDHDQAPHFTHVTCL